MSRGSRAPRPLPATGFALGFHPALEGLRGVAIALVLFHHLQALLAPWILPPRWQGGFLGVEAFFVLSGFLITSLLIEGWRREGVVSLRRFYRRRAVRLLPALYVVMVAQFIYSLAVHDDIENELKGLGVIGAYVVNWSISLGGPNPYTLGQTWSLGVEEQFYVIWPVVLLLGLRSRHRWVVPAILGVAISASTVVRVGMWMHSHSYILVYPQTQTYVDALMIGAACAYALYQGWRPGTWLQWAAPLAAAALGLTVYAGTAFSDWIYYGGFTCVSICVAALILSALEPASVVGRILAVSPLRFLGRISYGLYLWHVVVFVAISKAEPALPAVAAIAIALLISVGCATASYHLLELPLLRRERGGTRRDPAEGGRDVTRTGARCDREPGRAQPHREEHIPAVAGHRGGTTVPEL